MRKLTLREIRELRQRNDQSWVGTMLRLLFWGWLFLAWVLAVVNLIALLKGG